MKKRIAAIDIGTNTILMLLAESEGSGVFRILGDYHDIARLGESLGKTGKICDDAIERASNILQKYMNICRELDIDIIRTVGTAALREAKNGVYVRNVFENIIGFPVEIIPGEAEAAMSYLGAADNVGQASVLDIGGGSSELIAGAVGKILSRISLPIGAVKLTEKLLSASPPLESEISDGRKFIRNILIEKIKFPVKGELIAVAGTPTTIAYVLLGLNGYDEKAVQGYQLKLSELDELLTEFAKLKASEISEKYHIHPLRADVITMGGLILSEIMKFLGRNCCTVSSHGLRYGIMKDFINNKL
ncbi:MAG: exopolyphosphatase / guanosine-5-triphosphate,3-diphosphate pyrophosphatase [Bacteroidota bacterium]|nr:exopolyphosphatase / guanosine-5-triphosphate,3-diphosphate pyrophosphatase [Bacteroidota bacterium]